MHWKQFLLPDLWRSFFPYPPPPTRQAACIFQMNLKVSASCMKSRGLHWMAELHNPWSFMLTEKQERDFKITWRAQSLMHSFCLSILRQPNTVFRLSDMTMCCYCWVASVVSDSVRPHRRQPTRLLRPWDSPGKNTGVGCHFLLQT